MGLQHCKNRCVMRFSNTYEDALQKPDTLCETCRRLLDQKLAWPEL
jgi:archaemetzincin